MHHLSVMKSGLALGAATGIFHLCWAALVASGWAQSLIDFVLWLHFIKPVYVVDAFAIGRAAQLVVYTGAVGFLCGAVFALVWNALHRR